MKFIFFTTILALLVCISSGLSIVQPVCNLQCGIGQSCVCINGISQCQVYQEVHEQVRHYVRVANTFVDNGVAYQTLDVEVKNYSHGKIESLTMGAKTEAEYEELKTFNIHKVGSNLSLYQGSKIEVGQTYRFGMTVLNPFSETITTTTAEEDEIEKDKEEIVDNDKIMHLFFSTFVCDWDWLWKEFNNILQLNHFSKTSNNNNNDDDKQDSPQDLNNHDKNEDDHQHSIQIAISYNIRTGESEQPVIGTDYDHFKGAGRWYIDSTPYNFTLIHPPLPSRGGILHSKIILIEFTNFLRVVICSSNLTYSDWNILGQSIFFVDLQRNNYNNDDSNNNSDLDNNNFKNELIGLLDNLHFISPYDNQNNNNNNNNNNIETPIGTTIKEYLNQFNFKICIDNDIHIISSVPGTFNNNDFGLLKLQYQIKQLNLDDKEEEDKNNSNSLLSYQSSAVGLINNQYLDQFLDSTSPQSNKLSTCQINIIFPSKSTIFEMSRQNYLGALESVTIRYHDSFNLEKQHVLCDISYDDIDNNNESTPPIPIPLHSKILIYQNDSSMVSDQDWIYHGSHNFTDHSWGIVKSKRSESTKETITMNNFETGVWFRLNLLQDQHSLKKRLRFLYPAPKYTISEEPWRINQKNSIKHLKMLETTNTLNDNIEDENTKHYHWNQFKIELTNKSRLYK
eukprot:gene9365-11503_t